MESGSTPRIVYQVRVDESGTITLGNGPFIITSSYVHKVLFFVRYVNHENQAMCNFRSTIIIFFLCKYFLNIYI